MEAAKIFLDGVGKKIRKLWPMQTVKYYSALKRNELSSHENTWRNLKYMLLSVRTSLKRLRSDQIRSVAQSCPTL